MTFNDFLTLVEVSKSYGWKPQKDLTYINFALLAGIDDISAGNRDVKLLRHLYIQRYGASSYSPTKAWKYVIKLSKAFIKFYQDTPYAVNAMFTKRRYGNERFYVDEMGFYMCKDGSPPQGIMNIDYFGWWIIQSLAKSHGWVPHGILEQVSHLDGYGDFGTFDSNNWEEVSVEDAQCIACVLHMAIEDITIGLRDEDLMKAYECDEKLLKLFWSKELRIGEGFPDAAEFRKATIKLLERFIEFCERAPFRVG
jgi:hypothetical protein